MRDLLARACRVQPWLAKLANFGLTQMLVQGLTLLSGLAAARYLSTADYAQYAIYSSFLTALLLLSDSGLGSGVTSLAGRAGGSTEALGEILAAARRLRVRIANFLACIAVPSLALLLLHNGARPMIAIGLAIILLGSISVTLQGSLSQSAMTFVGDFKGIRRASLTSSLFRTSLTGALAVAPSLGSIWVAFVGGIASFWQSHALKRHLRQHLNVNGGYEDRTYHQLQSVVRRIFPLNLTFVIQGQLVIYLLGVIGATATLARLSALTRYSVAFILVGNVFSVVLSPAFARIQEVERPRILRSYLYILAGLITFEAATLLILGLLRHELLGLIGARYEPYQLELLIVLFGAFLSGIATSLDGIHQARGWLSGSWIFIPSTLLWAALAPFFLNHHGNLTRAAIFSASSALPMICVNVLRAYLGLKRRHDNSAGRKKEGGETSGIQVA